MSSSSKKQGPSFDWGLWFLIGLVLLGVLVVFSVLIEIPIWLLSRK